MADLQMYPTDYISHAPLAWILRPAWKYIFAYLIATSKNSQMEDMEM